MERYLVTFENDKGERRSVEVEEINNFRAGGLAALDVGPAWKRISIRKKRGGVWINLPSYDIVSNAVIAIR